MSQSVLSSRRTIPVTGSSMSSLHIIVRKFDRVMKRSSTWSIIALMAGMIVSIWMSVFTRYVMGDAILWGEQVAKYLMIWAAMIGSSLAIREGAHIAVTVLVDRLPEVLAKVCFVAAFIISSTFLCVAIYFGYFWAVGAAVQSDPSVWNMPLSIPYSAIPVGCSLMLIQLFLTLLKFLDKYEDH